MITPHPRADLLRAIADGKQMQELDFPGINRPGNWCDCDADRALNLIIRGVEQYVRIKPGTVTTMTDNKQYPELPTHFMLVQESFRDEVYLYTADQMRAYADADRAMRAAQAAPAAWRHSRTLGLFDIEEDVPLADGDEWAEPLYLHPPEAPASQDAEDAAQRKSHAD